jgi:hypothetical protein
VRENEHDWTLKYASISQHPLLDTFNSTPTRKLFNDTSNQSTVANTAVSGSSQQQQVSNNSNNSNNNSSSPLEETGHDSVTHRALLKNELLKHAIIDVRVSLLLKIKIPIHFN